MNTRSALLLSFASLIFGAGQGCADTDNTIFIRQVLAPPVPADGVCIYTADATQATISQGVMDLALTDEYAPSILVGSQLNNRKNPSELRADTGSVTITGVISRVTDPDGAIINEFTGLRSGRIDASTGSDSVYSSMGAVAIDAKTTSLIKDDVKARGRTGRLVVARMKVYGTTLGGTEVESEEFAFPIKVCFGCLISFPADADDPNTPGVDCLGTTAAGEGAAQACHPGQDQYTDCRSCRSTTFCDRPLP